MAIKHFATLTLLLATFCVKAQNNPVRINPGIIMPKDSIESKLLILTLNDFLAAAQKPNEENKLILKNRKSRNIYFA